jgi:hypothetical protein
MWPIIRADLMSSFDTFWHLHMRSFQAVNEGILILIPKTSEASTLKDYRPNSLIHLIGKLFSKVLSNRLAPRLASLIHPTQSVFIKGSVIHDNFRYVHSADKILYVCNRSPQLLKVDTARAFDSVAWPILLQVMQHVGFSQWWRDWTSTLQSTASTRVCLNGVHGTRICHARGLRQGDPSHRCSLCL